MYSIFNIGGGDDGGEKKLDAFKKVKMTRDSHVLPVVYVLTFGLCVTGMLYTQNGYRNR